MPTRRWLILTPLAVGAAIAIVLSAWSAFTPPPGEVSIASGAPLELNWTGVERIDLNHTWVEEIVLDGPPSDVRVVASMPFDQRLGGTPGSYAVTRFYFNDGLALRSSFANPTNGSSSNPRGDEYYSDNWNTSALLRGLNTIRIDLHLALAPDGRTGASQITYGPPKVWIRDLDTDGDGVSDAHDPLPRIRNAASAILAMVARAAGALAVVGFGRPRT